MSGPWGVHVNEVSVFATGIGAGWWIAYLGRHESSGLVTCLGLTLQGGEWHLAALDKAEAAERREVMTGSGGMHPKAVNVRRLPAAKVTPKLTQALERYAAFAAEFDAAFADAAGPVTP